MRYYSLALAFPLTVLTAAQAAHGQSTLTRNDLLNAVEPTQVVGFTLDGASGLTNTKDGTVSFKTDNPFCFATPSTPCSFQVNKIFVRLEPFQVFTTEGTYTFSDAFASIEGPRTLVDSGFGMSVPIGTPVKIGAVVNGPHASGDLAFGESPTTLPLTVHVDAALGLTTIDGTFPFVFTVSQIPQTFTGSISGLISGFHPLLNTAPLVNAGADRQLTCPQSVTLNPSSVIDLENNIEQLGWVIPNIAVPRGSNPSVFLGEGAYTATLVASDVYYGIGRDSASITITEPAPQFTQLPVAIEADNCGSVNLGTVKATSPCGPVTITNDAPAAFKAGVYQITWRAVSPSGKTATTTQRVVVWLGDSAACCPPGTNVIVGTPNNDTLTGTSGADCIIGLGGQDTINGGGGADLISGGSGDDQIAGGAGNDVLAAGTGQDRVFGEAGDDALGGQDGDDRLEGGDGQDVLSGGQGQDLLYCGAGNDDADGGTGDDQLFGEAGDDLLIGGANNNRCTGGDGFDTILQCQALDTPEGLGNPPFGGTPNYDVCACRPAKCNDCASGAAACSSIVGCPQIIQCIAQTPGCNLPHECSGLCETGRSAAAIAAARQLASCFGGC